MSDLTGKFSTLELQLAAQQSDMMTLLTNIFNTLDVINTNNSLNTQRLLAALSEGNCGCDDGGPLFPPPADQTETELGQEALCKRVQFFIDLMRLGIIKNISAYVFSAGSLSQSALNGIVHQAMLDTDLDGSGIDAPLSSSDSTAISALAGNLIFDMGAVNASVELSDYADDMSIWDAVRDALYSAADSAAGFEAAQSALNSGSYNSKAVTMVKRLFNTAWTNIIYSEMPEVDDAAYDGGACNEVLPTECFNVEANYIDLGGYFRWVVYMDDAYVGWYVNVVEPSITVHVYGDGDPGKTIDQTPYQLTTANINIGLGKFFFSNEYAGYTLRMCPAI